MGGLDRWNSDNLSSYWNIGNVQHFSRSRISTGFIKHPLVLNLMLVLRLAGFANYMVYPYLLKFQGRMVSRKNRFPNS